MDAHLHLTFEWWKRAVCAIVREELIKAKRERNYDPEDAEIYEKLLGALYPDDGKDPWFDADN